MRAGKDILDHDKQSQSMQQKMLGQSRRAIYYKTALGQCPILASMGTYHDEQQTRDVYPMLRRRPNIKPASGRSMTVKDDQWKTKRSLSQHWFCCFLAISANAQTAQDDKIDHSMLTATSCR